ncbi:MAG: hypothetical protein RDV48_09090 [Candidatus Eremiobacteraeota bacterium]|nr:hypothetical protein [Candidatus Eremiobacteraeota bacterium]
MVEYSRAYLRKYYDNFKFFDHECADKRIREINLRIRRCLKCPGKEQCRWHPEFWLEGEPERLAEDARLRTLEPDEPEEQEPEEEDLAS